MIALVSKMFDKMKKNSKEKTLLDAYKPIVDVTHFLNK